MIHFNIFLSLLLVNLLLLPTSQFAQHKQIDNPALLAKKADSLLFEAIQIKKKNGGRAVLPDTLHGKIQTFMKQAPIGQVREHIVISDILELLLVLLLYSLDLPHQIIDFAQQDIKVNWLS